MIATRWEAGATLGCRPGLPEGPVPQTPFFASRLFKEEVGKGFSELVNEIRVRHAMHLLTETSEPIQSIAQQVGYNNWSTFLRAFRKIAGVTPLQYRQNHAGNP